MPLTSVNPTKLLELLSGTVDLIEKKLSKSLYYSNQQIYTYLEENLHYTISHIRDTFKYLTEISLFKYITRRRYTLILEKMSHEDFKALSLRDSKCEIPSFKSKVLKEFPLIEENFLQSNMQEPIDTDNIHNNLSTIMRKRGHELFFRKCHNDITKGRSPFIINDSSNTLVIREPNTSPIDLDNVYFIYKDYFFKFTASVTPIRDNVPYGLYINVDQPESANNVLEQLHNFINKKTPITDRLSFMLEWKNTCTFGCKNLISSMTISDDQVKKISFTSNPFLLFDNDKIIFDTSTL